MDDLESIYTAYLSLSSHINTFDKNDRCLKEFMKITYYSYKPLLAYFNKFHEEAYKKSFTKFIRKSTNQSS